MDSAGGDAVGPWRVGRRIARALARASRGRNRPAPLFASLPGLTQRSGGSKRQDAHGLRVELGESSKVVHYGEQAVCTVVLICTAEFESSSL